MTRLLARCAWPAIVAILLGVMAVVAMPATCDAIASVVGETVLPAAPRAQGDLPRHLGAASPTRDAVPAAVAASSRVSGAHSSFARVLSAGLVHHRHIAPVLIALTVVVLLTLVLTRRPLGVLRPLFAVSDPQHRVGPSPRGPPLASCPSAHSRPRCAQRPIAMLGEARGSEETQWPMPLVHRASRSLVSLPG